MKSSVIRARCDDALKARVLRAAQRMGVEEADIVRLAVMDYLHRHDKPGPSVSLTLSVPADDSSPHPEVPPPRAPRRSRPRQPPTASA